MAAVVIPLAARAASAQSCLQVPSASYPTISAAVASFAGRALSADQCISVAAGDYNEQVDVEGVDAAGFRLLIESTGPVGGAVVQPPAGSTAAFILASANITVQGFTIAAAGVQTYGILISSSGAAIVDSSVSVNGAAAYALYAGGSSDDAISGSVLSNSGGGDGAFFSGGGDEAISASTFSTVDAPDGALYFLNNAGSTVTRSFMVDAGPGACAGGSGNAEGLALDGASGAVVSFSTITSNGGDVAALLMIDGADGDQILSDYVADAYESDAVFIDAASYGNSIAQSALAANSSYACKAAVLEIGGSSNTVSGTMVSDAGTNEAGHANGIFLGPGASFNTVTGSTVTVNGQFYGVLFLEGDNAGNQFSGDYFGGDAYANHFGQSYVVWLASTDIFGQDYGPDTGNALSNSAISQTGTTDPALGLSGAADDGFSGLRIVNATGGDGIDLLSSTRITLNAVSVSEASGLGIVAAGGDSGLLLSSDTVTGASVGLRFADAAPDTAVSALTFRSLTAGATDMQFLSGVWDSTFSAVDFADSPGNHEANVDASGIASGNAIAFADATGPLAGHAYADDPDGVVLFLSTAPGPGAPGGGSPSNGDSDGAAAGLGGAKVFPNPFRPALGETAITFAGLPADATLKVYDILGERVRELSAGADGAAVWDGRNSGGDPCASGVYFVVAASGSGRAILKVAIQR